MMQKTFINVFLPAILFYHVTTLNVVPGKSGEEQVKEALQKAQKESEEAAGNDNVKSKIDNENHELKTNYEGGSNQVLPTNDLVSVLTKKFEEITKDRHNRPFGVNGKEQNAKLLNPPIQEISQVKEDSGELLDRDSDTNMVLIANRLNNLMQKFQRKLASPTSTYLTKHGKLSSLSTSHSRTQLNEQSLLSPHKSLLLPERYREESAQVKSIRGHPNKAGIDLSALRKALGLLHKGSEKGGDSLGNESPDGSKTSYKEDTKLEDKLALEAEEEKKFSNSENYEYGMGQGDSKSSASSSSSAANSLPAGFSPKDQASKEMQSYNDLISSESNRELTQIQDEITKATQSSLGDVSVVGQKEHVSTESPENPLGGIGSLDGVDSMSQEPGGSMDAGAFSNNNGASMKGAIDSSSLGPMGNTESFPGSSAANEALEASLRASANADMNGESMPSDNEPTPETQSSQGGNM